MVQNSGTKVQIRGKLSEADYIRFIADALVSELGSTAQSAKTIMRWTNASDRSARNWLGGEKGPSGRYLMLLARQSPAVWAAMLAMTDKEEAALTEDIHAAEVALSKALGSIERLKRSQIGRRFSEDG